MAEQEPKASIPAPHKTREDVAIEWVLGEIGETLTLLTSTKRRLGELDGSLKDAARSLERSAQALRETATSMLEQHAELDRKAAESRLTFAKGFSEYCSDLSAKIVRSAVLGALGGGIMGGLIILGAWFITHR
jgi:hypothetical protein